jgi:hypothetical protein
VNKQEKQSEIPEPVLKRWWWRRLVFVKFDEESHTTQRKMHVPEYPSYGFSIEWNMWHRKDELTAFRFELLRRTSFPSLPEWHSLPAWLNAWVLGVLAPKPERSVCAMFGQPPLSGYASLGGWMWDLTASDESLSRFFILKINEERRKRGLPDTGDPFSEIIGNIQKHAEKRRGERSRQVSWLAVEAHDIKSYQVRPLTDGERSRLSKARREISDFEALLRAAIENAENHTPEKNRDASGESLYARFIRENFVHRLASRIGKQ